MGECRFSKFAPKWGEFYLIQGDAALLEAPRDWQSIKPPRGHGKHLLFYFRDGTFECIAEQCIIDSTADNSLLRTKKTLATDGQNG